MKVAYFIDVYNQNTFAPRTIAEGFKNAFIDKGHDFIFIDITKLKGSFGVFERLKFRLFNPDIIFISLENIFILPKNIHKNAKFVIWGEFFLPCDYEPQIHHMLPQTKKLLYELSKKHDIVVWSQHDEEINDQFYAGYSKEMGLSFIQLLHAADKTKYVEPTTLHPIYDFMWIGNIGHRQMQYDKFITPLKSLSSNYLDFTEFNKGDPEFISRNKFYSKSCIIPNIHTPAQIAYQILVNERIFTAPIQGGFQICDNKLARKYFSKEELIIAEKPADFIDQFIYFKEHPDERLPYIHKMQQTILKNHTYHNRVDEVFSAFLT